MSRRSRTSGLTLIEVVVSIGLLGSLLAGILFAFGRHKRQLVNSHARTAAATQADQLLHRWAVGGQVIPSNEQGVIGAPEQFRWQTSRLGVVTVGPSKAEVIKLQVFEQGDQNSKVLFEVQLLGGSALTGFAGDGDLADGDPGAGR